MITTTAMGAIGAVCTGVCLAAASTDATAPSHQSAVVISTHLEVFVLTGQSNRLGTTADSGEKAISPGEDPLDARIPFFW